MSFSLALGGLCCHRLLAWGYRDRSKDMAGEDLQNHATFASPRSRSELAYSPIL